MNESERLIDEIVGVLFCATDASWACLCGTSHPVPGEESDTTDAPESIASTGC